MYYNIYFDKFANDIHIWDDIAGYEKVKFENYAYILDPNGDHVTIDGLKCKKTYTWSDTAISAKMVFEHDVPATTRYLIDRYGDSDTPSARPTTMFFDIEVAKEGKYSSVEDANNTITSIAYYTEQSGYRCLVLDTKSKSSAPEIVNVTVGDNILKVSVSTISAERELLTRFLREYRELNPSILTGWNIDYYDIPYLYNRITNVCGGDYAKQLSPINKVRTKEFGKRTIIDIAGVTALDYIMLYKKFTYSEQPNYKLNTIATIELGRGKVEYDGSLDQLYQTDLAKFIEYNVIDVELIYSMDKKLDYINVARGICHKGHVPYDDIVFTSRYLDGAALTYCRRNNLVASSTRVVDGAGDGQAEGAYVMDPIPGLYKWVYDLDLTSLYPMNIITLNISPETKFGKILNWNEAEWVDSSDRKYRIKLFKDGTIVGKFQEDFGVPKNELFAANKQELKDIISQYNLSVASNGMLYTLDKIGLIPAILSTWFDDRDSFKNLRKQYEKEGDDVLAGYYDQQQLITKIMLNSFYGVLLLNSFRFYDKDNGESVTITGQSVIKWAVKMANYYYNKKLDTNSEYVLYCDTDSVYLPALPLIRNVDIESLTDEEIAELVKPIINDVQAFINNSYGVYAKKFHMVDSHRWDIKQELIARRALWIAKKRYAQWIVNKEGHTISKLNVKGLDTVRSSFPPAFRKFLTSILIDILHDKSNEYLNKSVLTFKNKMSNVNVLDILAPTSAKEVAKYDTGKMGVVKSGTPVHIKSALNYNNLLSIFGIDNIPKITDGDKIVWGYLRNNKYNFETLALTGENDDKRIIDFINEFVDRDKIFHNGLINKLQSYWDAMNWGQITFNTNIGKFF